MSDDTVQSQRVPLQFGILATLWLYPTYPSQAPAGDPENDPLRNRLFFIWEPALA